MVLPTLQSYSATKHLSTPRQIIQTEKQDERTQIMNNSKTSNRPISGQSKWSSPISGELNDETLRIEQEELKTRQSHLSSILDTNRNKFQDDLTSRRQSSRESILHQEIERQILPDEKSYDNWTTDQQKLENLRTQYESLKLNDKDLMLQQEFDQRLDEYERQIQEKQNERKKRIEQLKVILTQQMDEIKLKEEELEIFKEEEQRFLREKQQLEQYEEERKQMEQRYIQLDCGRQLLRQHKTKLHKRAKEIQEELELDVKILASIAKADKGSRLELSAQQEQLGRDALHLLVQFQQQIRLEKEKEQEIDAMYQDEAAKQWSHRNQEWNQDKESREKLMHRIMNERQELIMQKLQSSKEQQRETCETQRSLVNDMELARKYNLLQKEKQAKQEEEKEQDLQRQILILKQEKSQALLELQKQDAIEREKEKQQELLASTNVQPKFHGRRRINWN